MPDSLVRSAADPTDSDSEVEGDLDDEYYVMYPDDRPIARVCADAVLAGLDVDDDDWDVNVQVRPVLVFDEDF